MSDTVLDSGEGEGVVKSYSMTSFDFGATPLVHSPDSMRFSLDSSSSLAMLLGAGSVAGSRKHAGVRQTRSEPQL